MIVTISWIKTATTSVANLLRYIANPAYWSWKLLIQSNLVYFFKIPPDTLRPRNSKLGKQTSLLQFLRAVSPALPAQGVADPGRPSTLDKPRQPQREHATLGGFIIACGGGLLPRPPGRRRDDQLCRRRGTAPHLGQHSSEQ